MLSKTLLTFLAVSIPAILVFHFIALKGVPTSKALLADLVLLALILIPTLAAIRRTRGNWGLKKSRAQILILLVVAPVLVGIIYLLFHSSMTLVIALSLAVIFAASIYYFFG